MFWFRNKKNNFQLCTFIWRPVWGPIIAAYHHFSVVSLLLSYHIRPVGTMKFASLEVNLGVGVKVFLAHYFLSPSLVSPDMNEILLTGTFILNSIKLVLFQAI